jgi:hypothetical protein
MSLASPSKAASSVWLLIVSEHQDGSESSSPGKCDKPDKMCGVFRTQEAAIARGILLTKEEHHWCCDPDDSEDCDCDDVMEVSHLKLRNGMEWAPALSVGISYFVVEMPLEGKADAFLE